MGKGNIICQKRLELIDECLRKYDRPMTIKEISKYCNQRLNTDTTERMYRYYLEKIDSDYGLKLTEIRKETVVNVLYIKILAPLLLRVILQPTKWFYAI